MTPAEVRERFLARLQQKIVTRVTMTVAAERLQQQFDAATIEAARPFYRKTKAYPELTANRAADLLRKHDPELYEKTRKPFADEATATARRFSAQQDLFSVCLNALAETAEVRPGTEWKTVQTYSDADYSSQTDSSGYAQRNARIREIELRGAGVPVRRVESHGIHEGSRFWPAYSKRDWYKCDVQAQVADDLDVEILKRRSVSLREWVRLCWANGVNPRVMHPFLPWGFEEKVGIDYQGRDLMGGEQVRRRRGGQRTHAAGIPPGPDRGTGE